MKLHSLTMRSELLTLSGISHIEEHDGYLVQATPTEPDFWMGNQLIVSDLDQPVSELLTLFKTHFPDAAHRAIVWDIPNVDRSAIDALNDANGKIEGFETMTLNGPLAEAHLPDGFAIRPVETEADWASAERLMAEVGIEEGRDPVSHGPYLARRNAGRRAQIAKDLGQWFAVFDGDEVVAQMGIFHDAQIARYQSVETKATYRGRGLCSALLRHAAQWALGRAPDATVVIVADAESDAGRLYKKMGFTRAEVLYGLVREGY